MTYFQVKVTFKTENDKGKISKENVVYLVDSMSCTESETKVVAFLERNGERDFEIKATSESKIAAVL